MSERRLRLKASRANDTSVRVDVLVDESGDVVMEGQDVGAAPQTFFGDSDYEYWVTVRAADKDALLLNLLVDRFVHEADETTAFRKWLKAKGIPHEFFSY
jgi:hypothetical protein